MFQYFSSYYWNQLYEKAGQQNWIDSPGIEFEFAFMEDSVNDAVNDSVNVVEIPIGWKGF